MVKGFLPVCFNSKAYGDNSKDYGDRIHPYKKA